MSSCEADGNILSIHRRKESLQRDSDVKPDRFRNGPVPKLTQSLMRSHNPTNVQCHKCADIAVGSISPQGRCKSLIGQPHSKGKLWAIGSWVRLSATDRKFIDSLSSNFSKAPPLSKCSF